MQKIGQYVQVDGASAIVEVEGKYHLLNTVKVNDELADAFRQGCTQVRLDMARTTYIDSSVVRDIVRLMRRMGERNVRIRNASGRVFAVLHAAALDKLVDAGGQG